MIIANRKLRNVAVVVVAMSLIAGLTITMRRKPSVPVARIGASNVRGLTGSVSSCSITEGQTGGTCTISISPAAGAGASLTFAVTARTKGTSTQAFSPVDANGEAPGGTGPDVSVVGSTGNSVTVSIPNGATSVAFPLTAIDDDFTELDKTITATISGAVGVTLDSTASTTTVTIVDNDRTGIFPVANYGGIPDDGLSDSAAIQAAAAAACASGRGVVTFVSGQFDTTPATSGPIRPCPGTAMSGAGDRATILRRAAMQCGAAPVVAPKCAVQDIKVDLWNSSADSPWLVMSNLILDGNNGNQATYKDFRQEHAHLIYLSGSYDAGTARANNTGRLRVITQHLTTRSSVADGISYHVNVEGRDWDTRGEGNFRGHLVMTGGNDVMQWWSFTTTHGGATGLYENTGIDIEVDAFGRHPTKGLTVDSYVDIKHAVIDADLDASTYLPPDWMGSCFAPTGTTQCGTGSTITIDDLQMQPSEGAYYQTGGAVFLGVMRSQDSITITNSTLRFGGHNLYNESVVWFNQGVISIADSRVIIGEYPYPSHDSAYTQPSLRVQSMQQSFSGGTFNLVRTSFEADGAPSTPSSKCATERTHPTLPVINWASVSLIGTGWCGTTGYTGGTVNVSTAPASTNGSTTTTTSSTTTTTAVPEGPTYDDTDGAFVYSALTSATTTTTSTTTTTTPSTTRKEVETCTLGGSVTVASGSPAGASGSGVFGNAPVGSGTTASCSITAGSSGSYTLTMRYQNAGSYQRPVTVNGSAQSPPSGPTFPATSNDWSTLVLTVTLTSGANTIVIDTSYQWFDWIEIAATTGSTTTTTSATTTTTTAPAEADGWVAYGPPGVLDPRDYLQTNHTTSKLNATATISFTGTSAVLYGAKGPAGGKATVQRDAAAPITIDTYSATEQRNVVLWSESGLSNSAHTVLVTVLHTNTSPSTNYYVVLDRLAYQVVAATTTSTSGSVSSTSSTTIPSQGTAIWHDEFDAFDPTNATTDKAWAMNDPTWQNDERGYIDFAGPGTWNANRWESLATTGGGTTVLDPFSVSGGVLTVTNAPLPSNVAGSVRTSADAQGQGVVPTPTRYGGYLVTNRKYTNPTTGQPLEFLGGYFEWRVRFPQATGTSSRGMFPALWLYASLGSANTSDKGRAEIDVLESFGHASGSPFNITTHQQNNAGVDVIPQVDVASVPWSPSAWHKVALDWKRASDPGGAALRFYLDGVLVGQVTGTAAAWFTTPMSIRMNIASDAPWFDASKKTDSGTAATWQMQVDYVRVYSSAPAGSVPTTTTTSAPASTTTTTGVTTTTRPTTTTTAPGATTTTIVGTRTVTVSAWQDTDRDGVQDAGEPTLGGSQVRLRNPSGVSTKLVTLKKTSATFTVPVGAGWSLLFTPPAGSTSTAASVAAIPATGAFSVQFGGCCPRVTS